MGKKNVKEELGLLWGPFIYIVILARLHENIFEFIKTYST